jgi:hypothetical protein
MSQEKKENLVEEEALMRFELRSSISFMFSEIPYMSDEDFLRFKEFLLSLNDDDFCFGIATDFFKSDWRVMKSSKESFQSEIDRKNKEIREILKKYSSLSGVIVNSTLNSFETFILAILDSMLVIAVSRERKSLEKSIDLTKQRLEEIDLICMNFITKKG